MIILEEYSEIRTREQGAEKTGMFQENTLLSILLGKYIVLPALRGKIFILE